MQRLGDEEGEGGTVIGYSCHHEALRKKKKRNNVSGSVAE